MEISELVRGYKESIMDVDEIFNKSPFNIKEFWYIYNSSPNHFSSESVSPKTRISSIYKSIENMQSDILAFRDNNNLDSEREKLDNPFNIYNNLIPNKHYRLETFSNDGVIRKPNKTVGRLLNIKHIKYKDHAFNTHNTYDKDYGARLGLGRFRWFSKDESLNYFESYIGSLFSLLNSKNNNYEDTISKNAKIGIIYRGNKFEDTTLYKFTNDYLQIYKRILKKDLVEENRRLLKIKKSHKEIIEFIKNLKEGYNNKVSKIFSNIKKEI